MAFDIDFNERGYIREHIWEFLLFPTHWNDPKNQILHTLNWTEVQFDDANVLNVPDNLKGIYCFVVKPKFNQLFETRYLFYTGITTRDFRVRFKEYLRDQKGKGKPRPKVFSMLKLWAGYLHFYYAPLNIDSHIKECEDKLLNSFVPRVNTDIPEARIKPELLNIYL
jgi:hypothetical protein